MRNNIYSKNIGRIFPGKEAHAQSSPVSGASAAVYGLDGSSGHWFNYPFLILLLYSNCLGYWIGDRSDFADVLLLNLYFSGEK